MNSQLFTNTNVVRDRQLLERRIKYFIESERGGRAQATALIKGLSAQSHLYIFGGLIRDIGLYTAHRFRSDIDLVFAGSRNELEKALAQYGFRLISENKFGGFRIGDAGIEIDVWSLEETWAFRHGLIAQKSVEGLLQTTLMSWDSVLYDIRNHKIIAEDSWLEDLHARRLDLVLEQTPNTHSALVKILRTVYGKRVLQIGSRLSTFLASALGDISDSSLIDYETQRFDTHYLNRARLSCLRQALDDFSGETEIQVTCALTHGQ